MAASSGRRHADLSAGTSAAARKPTNVSLPAGLLLDVQASLLSHLATVPRRLLYKQVCNLQDEASTTVNAVDCLFQGV